MGCNEGGEGYIWTEEKRRQHFMEHVGAIEETEGMSLVEKLKHRIANKSKVSGGGRTRVSNCRTCNVKFEQERKRGRPKIFCPIHEKKVLNGTV